MDTNNDYPIKINPEKKGILAEILKKALLEKKVEMIEAKRKYSYERNTLLSELQKVTLKAWAKSFYEDRIKFLDEEIVPVMGGRVSDLKNETSHINRVMQCHHLLFDELAHLLNS